MNITIRKMQIIDINVVKELYNDLSHLMAAYEPYYMQEFSQSDQFLETIIYQKDNFIGFVAEINSKVKGFSISQLRNSLPHDCLIKQKYIYLMDIAVREDYRSKGIGKALINQVKQWGIENEVDYLELEVLTKNKSAIKKYLSEGFTEYCLSMRMKLK